MKKTLFVFFVVSRLFAAETGVPKECPEASRIKSESEEDYLLVCSHGESENSCATAHIEASSAMKKQITKAQNEGWCKNGYYTAVQQIRSPSQGCIVKENHASAQNFFYAASTGGGEQYKRKFETYHIQFVACGE